jgi:2-dehydropantoate 2-reductase
MGSKQTIYVLGCGAVGFPLAAYLSNVGRNVVAVRTSRKDIAKGAITIDVHNGANCLSIPVETASLSKLTHLDGTLVITAKSYANQAIAQELKDKAATGPIVIMQNGVGVEKPFIEANFSPIYRCILYVTSQAASEYDFSFRPVTPSPIGVINGSQSGLKKCIEDLTTDNFPFRAEANIQRETWKKAIINSVFNSICPLLEVDNGIFARDKETANLAKEVVMECLMLTGRLEIELSINELMDQIMQISKHSDGQLISTLQDIRSSRQTEIEFLNLEIARVAAALQPRLSLPRTELLGKLILAKSFQHRERESQG